MAVAIQMKPSSCEAIVLAGGFGTRLQSVRSDIPKPMFPCAGEPFLEWVLRYLQQQGLARSTISVGHLGEQIEEFIARSTVAGMKATCVRETSPLGTGGAIGFAWSRVPESTVCVVNGDSLLLASLQKAWTYLADPSVEAVIVGRPMEDASRYGTLEVDGDNRLLAFLEKQPGAGLINAGIYLLKPSLRSFFPTDERRSVETDVFPQILKSGRTVKVAPIEGPFIDIGIPETLALADQFIDDYWSN